jgi:tetratricopeptide (TPR) repeat protein
MKTPIEELLAVAIGLVNAGQRERARLVCDKAVADWPAHPAIHQLLAFLDLQAGDAAGARRHAELSLSLRPDHVPTLFVAGEAALALRDPAGAARAHGRAVALAPAHVDAWFSLSQARHDLRDLAGAEAALQRVLALKPDRADALVNLGILLQEQGRVDDALRAYGRAYRLREETFGRIAHALATPGVGRLWLRLDDLRAELRARNL